VRVQELNTNRAHYKFGITLQIPNSTSTSHFFKGKQQQQRQQLPPPSRNGWRCVPLQRSLEGCPMKPVEIAIVSVVRCPIFAGQFVTVGAQEVTV
jgi:hypothetical protein